MYRNLCSLLAAGALSPFLGACALPDEDFDRDGFSQIEGDCADLDPRIHPEATDVVGDGIDQNCDGADPSMEESGKSHSCQLIGGDIACTGDNDYGQLDVPEVEFEFIELAAGYFHTCGLETTGMVVCWGDNRYGQSSPPDDTFVTIEADANWSLGIREDGTLDCWGLCFASAAP